MKHRVPADPTLTSIAIAYRNPDSALIGDEVMPKVKPVGTETFKYLEYNLADGYSVPDNEVGRKGRVNEVSFSAEEKEASTKDYGLEDPIPSGDIEAAKSRNINVLGESVEYIMNLNNLAREVRVAKIVQDPGNYSSNNIETLSGTDMFTSLDADPLSTLHDVLNSMFIRGNTLTMSSYIWNLFRRHPNVLKQFFPNGGGASITRQQLVDELEIKRLLVGESFVNTARKGHDAKLERTWGNSLAFHYQDREANTRKGMTWGMTVPLGKPVAMQWPDKNIGLRGGVRVRAGEGLKELVIAIEAGALIQNAA
ncbi:hypothetical protein [Maridesulfovibrio sp.]|uniref:hypothetical protein n=1 Tax=Maridesulfovibrio sp. TaxID=2795000 RepID=UPI0029CA81B3|nr:hypothetical protein [Maridesulfovibrio sp.]